jgi:hypothetical protein
MIAPSFPVRSSRQANGRRRSSSLREAPAARSTPHPLIQPVKHHFCATCGCGTYSVSPDWSTGKADFENPKIGVNARLFDRFDLEAVPVVVIDGKNLW